jgi:hypothetical protein
MMGAYCTNMSEVDLPIVEGAKYRDIDGEPVRVKSVWVDEDLTTQVQIFHEQEYVENPASKTVDLESFVERISPTGLERVNSDHDAWEYRNE